MCNAETAEVCDKCSCNKGRVSGGCKCEYSSQVILKTARILFSLDADTKAQAELEKIHSACVILNQYVRNARSIIKLFADCELERAPSGLVASEVVLIIEVKDIVD